MVERVGFGGGDEGCYEGGGEGEERGWKGFD